MMMMMTMTMNTGEFLKLKMALLKTRKVHRKNEKSLLGFETKNETVALYKMISSAFFACCDFGFTFFRLSVL
jgi:hypothetical protein